MTHIHIRERGVLLGCMIGAVAGIAWAIWAAVGLSDRTIPGAVALALVGVVVGVVILTPIRTALHESPAKQATASGPSFSSPRYRHTVALEVTAIIAGVIILGIVEQPTYIPPLIAVAVGIHFLSFVPSWRGFLLLSLALVVAGVAGVVIGIAGGSKGDVMLIVGLLASISLFASSARIFIPRKS